MAKSTHKLNHIKGDRPLEAVLEYDGTDIFVIADGMKIAKRGYPGTPEAGTWVSLRRGWAVEDNANHSIFTVMHDGIVRN
ncbi:MAG: hypothetical protein ACLP19_15600 [Xanthobacteraceae bacterium]